jgi:hypothetical protein
MQGCSIVASDLIGRSYRDRETGEARGRRRDRTSQSERVIHAASTLQKLFQTAVAAPESRTRTKRRCWYSPFRLIRGSAVKWSRCSRNSTPGRVVTAVLKPSSPARANSRGPRRGRIAKRVAEVLGAPPQGGLDNGHARAHLGPHAILAHLSECRLADGVAANGHQRVGRQLRDFSPGHTLFLA